MCGGRDWRMTKLAAEWLDATLWEINPHRILHGAARGADVQAAEVASREFPDIIEAFPADWKTHGKSAGPIRNREMLNSAMKDGAEVFVLAFPGGIGTANMCVIAAKQGATIRAYTEVPAP